MSLRTLIVRHIEDAAGSYAPNHFLLTLDKDTPFITGPDDNLTLDPQLQHIFFHEYWHYLQNVTTVSGFKSFAFSQHLLSPFSKTLLRRGDGTSDGASDLTTADRENVKVLLELQRTLDGDAAPTNALANDWDVNFRVHKISLSQAPRKHSTQDAPNPITTLDIECAWPDGRVAKAKLNLGSLAIEESVAFLVEEQVRNINPSIPFEAPPIFPYRVVERTLEYILARSVDPFIAAALGTLALLTTHPGPGLIQLANAYRTELLSGKDSDDALNSIVQVHRQSLTPVIELILNQDIPSLQRMHVGRGLMEGAFGHVGSTLRQALGRRLLDPLFDVRPLFPVATVNAITNLQRGFPSCDAVQERYAKPTVFPRDRLFAFDPAGEDANGNLPSVYTRSLQAQQDFVFSHLKSDGAFRPSSQCESRCPYYHSCHLPLRKSQPVVCGKAPWLAHGYPDGACWYASGVAATMGPVRIQQSQRGPLMP